MNVNFEEWVYNYFRDVNNWPKADVAYLLEGQSSNSNPDGKSSVAKNLSWKKSYQIASRLTIFLPSTPPPHSPSQQNVISAKQQSPRDQ